MNTIAQIKEWPDSAVVEAIQGTIDKVWDRKEGVGKEGKSSVQNAEFKDAGGNQIGLAVWDHADLKALEGKEVVIHSTRGGNGKFGGVSIKHESYVAKKDGPNHKVGDTVKVVKLSISRLGQFQYVEVYNSSQNKAPDSPTPTPSTPAPSNGVKTQGNPASGAPTKSIHGATVGMCLNQACAFLIAEGEALDPKRVYEIASGLVKVALYMEAGHLHEPKKEETSPEPVKGPNPF